MLLPLEYVHRRKLIHGDIKIQNYMIDWAADGTETVKLCDFGLTDFINESGEVYLKAA